jgi:hypothetical protein
MAFSFRLGFLFVLVLAITVEPLGSAHVNAHTEQSSWIKPDHPTIDTLHSDIPQSLLPSSRSRDCLPETRFITRHKNVSKGHTESSHLSCATQTAFGFYSSYNGYIKLNDNDLAGQARSSSNGALTTLGIPHSKHLIYTGSGLYGSSRYIIKDFAANSSTVVLSDGTIQHRLKPGVSGTPIKDSKGAVLELRDLRFSSNGKWAVGDVPFRGMTRINVETGETLMFGRSSDYSIGLNPDLTSAVSGDGRYALISEPKYNLLKIYDLAACQATADPVKQSCAEKDLLPFIKSRIADYSEVWRAQFSTNYSIRVYVRKKDKNNQYSQDYQLWTAVGRQEAGLEYLALGDSFTSGEGAHSYKPGTDIEKPFNKCHLSTLSYPYLIAGSLGLNSTESVACSGAKMKDIFTSDTNNYNYHLKQSEGKEPDEFNNEIFSTFVPGYRTQSSFVAKNKPRVVTLSVVGNDVGFGKILLNCLMPGTCYQSEQERLDLAYTINSKFDELTATYQHIKDDSASNAKIYVMGYPSLATPYGECALNVHLNHEEIIFSNQIINQLNNTAQRAASKAGVGYINVEDIFSGKRLCEAPSSEVAVNGLTAGDDKTFSVPLKLIDESLDFYLTGRESYHPNQIGHQLYADTIINILKDSDFESPLPSPASQPSNLANPSNLTPRKIELKDSLSNDFLLPASSIPLNAAGLLPSSQFTVSVASRLVQTSVAKSDQSGTISSTFTLPEDIELGVQTLHLRGHNSAGEPIDIQKLVYVAASQTDIDGDGTPNGQEQCLLVTASSIDTDEDGVDDACDGQIYKSPESSQPNLESNNAKRSVNNPANPTHGITEQVPLQFLKQPQNLGTLDEARSPALVQASLQVAKTLINPNIKHGSSLVLWAALVFSLLFIIFMVRWRKRFRHKL